LKAGVAQVHVREEIQNRLKEWFDQELRDWDISRDAPYSGCKIPDTEDKYFYMWLDAPISDFYESLEYGKAMKEIMRLADNANRYIDEKAPWNEAFCSHLILQRSLIQFFTRLLIGSGLPPVVSGFPGMIPMILPTWAKTSSALSICL
jgi:hypothetical protein